MQSRLSRRVAWIGVLAGCCAMYAAPGEPSAVTVLVDARNPGAEIPADFQGLSFEMETLLPGKAGYFKGSNPALAETFHNLGIRSLRIGGNTADRPTIPFPAIADVDRAFDFAKSARDGVIFTFRLRAGGPDDAAPIARHIVERYRSSLVCFAIGNEPDVYAKTYPAYRAELDRYMQAFAAAGVDAATFCGPGTTPGKAAWARQFAEDFASSARVRLVTQHAYFGGNSRKVADPAVARSAMLSAAWEESYRRFYQSFVPAVEAGKLAYRIEETNSFYNGGAKDVSDTFAAALWGLDYLHWWAAHGAAGVNFHTGEQVAAGDETTPCYYAVIHESEHGYRIQPLGYAMKAFDLAGHGRVVPVQLQSGPAGLNLRSYAVLSADNRLYVTLINKESGSAARVAAVSVVAGAGYARGEILRLEVPGGDVSAKSGVTLGGSSIEENGAWHGTWKPLEGAQDGRFPVQVPAASAAIVRFSAER